MFLLVLYIGVVLKNALWFVSNLRCSSFLAILLPFFSLNKLFRIRWFREQRSIGRNLYVCVDFRFECTLLELGVFFVLRKLLCVSYSD